MTLRNFGTNAWWGIKTPPTAPSPMTHQIQGSIARSSSCQFRLLQALGKLGQRPGLPCGARHEGLHKSSSRMIANIGNVADSPWCGRHYERLAKLGSRNVSIIDRSDRSHLLHIQKRPISVTLSAATDLANTKTWLIMWLWREFTGGASGDHHIRILKGNAAVRLTIWSAKDPVLLLSQSKPGLLISE